MITTHKIAPRIQTHCNPNNKVKTSKPRKRRERYSHPKKQSLAARILDLIEERGGMTSIEIKRQLFLWAYPDQEFDAKKHRGWWSDPLYGGMYSSWGAGLLKIFCNKVGRKWVRNKLSHEGHPWKVIMRGRGGWKASTWATPTSHIIMSYQPRAATP